MVLHNNSLRSEETLSKSYANRVTEKKSLFRPRWFYTKGWDEYGKLFGYGPVHLYSSQFLSATEDAYEK